MARLKSKSATVRPRCLINPPPKNLSHRRAPVNIDTTNNRLVHSDVRRACGAAHNAKEMTCPVCGHDHLQLFKDDGIKCQNGCNTEAVVAAIRRVLDAGEVLHVAG